ncbi:uncharacterized protein LOC106672116 [Cimex lectularius]|uniref:Uncharacterized protein n=1 Tax=Cimex lectularius TaxID=79782 RepID=A0A8I6S8D5_CIMLE|nr:uncharacterized protein LOC106672116 [Cimex lectularius]
MINHQLCLFIFKNKNPNLYTMVTLERNRQSEFDDEPDLDVVRKNLASLEQCIATAPDSSPGYKGGTYLSNKIFPLKAQNTIEVLPNDPFDDGNNLLPTIFNFTNLYLFMYIDVKNVGVQEGRGRVDVRPINGGLSVDVQEFDLIKRTQTTEAHGLRRVIYREYTIPGAFDWHKLVFSVGPDSTLTIRVPTTNHFRNY